MINAEDYEITEFELVKYKGHSEFVVIPEFITRIASYAFDHSKVRYIEVLGGTVHIAQDAFSQCTRLEKIVIKSEYVIFEGNILKGSSYYSHPTMIELKNGMLPFEFQNGLLVNTETKKLISCSSCIRGVVELPEDILIIGAFAFSGCTYITEVKLPDALQIIEEGAFHCCSHLEKINIPEGVWAIGSEAFYSAYSLKDIHIDGSAVIPQESFYACESLETIILGSKVQVIEKDAFYGCESLKLLRIPESVILIDPEMLYIEEVDLEAYYVEPDLVIECSLGSKAEEYAKKYGIEISYLIVTED